MDGRNARGVLRGSIYGLVLTRLEILFDKSSPWSNFWELHT